MGIRSVRYGVRMFTWSLHVVNAARKFSNKVKPGIGLHDAKHLVTLDTSRTEEVFPELPYRSIEDSTLAMIERLETLGWWTR